MRLHSHSWIIIWSKHRRKWNQGIFSFCCLEVIWLFMQSRGFTPFCSYNTLHQIPEDALAKSCQISLRPLSTALTLSFFVLCILFRVLGGLVSNCPCQFSRSLPDFHFSKIEWLSLLSLPKESSPWLENPLWVVVLTSYHTSPLQSPFLTKQQKLFLCFLLHSAGAVEGGRWHTWGC